MSEAPPRNFGLAGDEIRLLIADDQAVFRRGLHAVLGSEDNIVVVAEAQDGEEAVHKAEQFLPDVVLMDIRMPHLNGIDAARRIRAALPGTSIVMLTVSDEEDDLFDAIKAGANGYLLKEIPAEEVAGAVQIVAQGHSLISPSMASKLLREFNALAEQAAEKDSGREATRVPAGPAEKAPPAEHLLTPREVEVLDLVARGLSNREIADQLFISENTVKSHMRNILEKLHLHSRVEAVMYAVRQRLFDPPVSDG